MIQAAIGEIVLLMFVHQHASRVVGSLTIRQIKENASINHAEDTEEEPTSQHVNATEQTDHHTKLEEEAAETAVDREAESAPMSSAEIVVPLLLESPKLMSSATRRLTS